MKIYPVNIPLASGISGQVTQSSLAVADSLYLGSVLIRHAVFFVLPDEQLKFSKFNYSQKGLIGEPIIAQLGEVRLFKNGDFVIPKVPGSQDFQNLALNGLVPIANFQFGMDSLPFQFDTGASTSVAYEPFYDKYRALINLKGKAYQLHSMGVGGAIVSTPAYALPDFRLNAGGMNCRLDTIHVRTTPVGAGKYYYYGNLGLDLFRNCREVVLNFRYMYLLAK